MPPGIYTSYKDGNGVTWSIYETANKMFAYVPDDAAVIYSGKPGDLERTKPGVSDSASDTEVAERDRRTFSNLRESIDEYAAEHPRDAIIRVVAPRSSSTMVLIIAAIGIALLSRRS